MFKFLSSFLGTCFQKTNETVVQSNVIYYESGIIKYVGQVQDGKKHGTGKLFSTSGKLYYEGSWRNDKREGYGIGLFYDEFSYAGLWINNKPHGKGILYYRDYTFYNGEFLLGEFHGFGIKYFIPCCSRCPSFAKNKIDYEGTWKMGKRHGMGISYEHRLIHETWYHQAKYKGSFQNDLYDGNGFLYYSGSPFLQLQYFGSFSEGNFHGNGEIYYITGVCAFKGSFFHGKKHGDGYIFNETGELVSCTTFLFGHTQKEYEKLQNLKTVMNIRSFLDTKLESYIETVSVYELIDYIEKTYDISLTNNHSKERIVELLDSFHSIWKTKDTTSKTIDLFGNEIKTPVRGSDDTVYDLQSMTYLFEKNEDGDYKNISYRYENGLRVPNFPVMGNGKTLQHYEIIH